MVSVNVELETKIAENWRSEDFKYIFLAIAISRLILSLKFKCLFECCNSEEVDLRFGLVALRISENSSFSSIKI